MTAFTEQIKDLFGDQLKNINLLQQQTISALQQSVDSMNAMVEKFGAAGANGATEMAQILTDAINAAETRQQIMNDKINEVLEQIKITNTETKNSGTKSVQDMAKMLTQAMEDTGNRQQKMNEQMTILVNEINKNIQSTQSETGIKLQETLNEMSSTMLTLMNSVDGKVNVITGEGEKVVGEFGGQLNSLVDGVTLVVNEMKMAVDVMRQTTTEALTKMNAGANTLAGAANDFAQAGNGVSNTLEKSNEVAKGLREASVSLTTVSSGLNGVLDDYKLARSSMADLVDSMKVIVEQARKEANLTTDILLKFDNATQKLIAAQKEADEYLTKITEVIVASHGAFTSGMNKSIDDLREGITHVVGQSNSDFYDNLSQAVLQLQGGVKDISDVFEDAAERVSLAANKVSK
jgi:hypothetical protein